MKRSINIYEEGCFLKKSSNKNSYLFFWKEKNIIKETEYESLLDIVDKNSNQLRDIYLSWIKKLGEFKFSGETVIDILKIRGDHSLWWATSLAQKCNFSKSKNINDTIKIIALDLWINQLEKEDFSEIDLIKYIGTSKEISLSLKSLSTKYKKKFYWEKKPSFLKQKKFLKRIFFCLPNIIQALIWLSHFFLTRIRLKRFGISNNISKSIDISIFSFFCNIEKKFLNEFKFNSKYWGNLPEKLENAKFNIRWIHLYEPKNNFKKISKVKEFLSAVNRKKQSTQHLFFESFLSINVVLQVLNYWIKLIKKWEILRNLLNLQHIQNIDVSNIYFRQWKSDFLGIRAVNNLMYYFLLDTYFKSSQRQELGFYLMENQPWEFFLIQLWKDYKNGFLVGVPHSTISFWDLRYFYKKSLYQASKKNLPLPNLYAINSPLAYEKFIFAGVPSKKIIKVEALRYSYLEKLKNNKNDINIKGDKFIKEKEIRIIVLCSYEDSSTNTLIDLVQRVEKRKKFNLKIILKPHPVKLLYKVNFPFCNYEITNKSLDKIFPNVDIAISSVFTSSAVDAWCNSLDTINVLDPDIINISPLYGVKEANFVINEEELEEAILRIITKKNHNNNPKEFFYLNKELPRWMNLIRKYGTRKR